MNYYFVFCLLFLSIEDYINYEIYLFNLILLFLSIFADVFHYDNLLLTLIVGALLYIVNQKFNVADLLIMAFASSQIHFETLPIFVFFIGFSSSLYLYLLKKNKTALIPFIFISMVLCVFLEQRYIY